MRFANCNAAAFNSNESSEIAHKCKYFTYSLLLSSLKIGSNNKSMIKTLIW